MIIWNDENVDRDDDDVDEFDDTSMFCFLCSSSFTSCSNGNGS